MLRINSFFIHVMKLQREEGFSLPAGNESGTGVRYQRCCKDQVGEFTVRRETQTLTTQSN